MSNWKGYFIKSVKNNRKFPMSYIASNGWKALPNSRQELKAYRDDNTQELTRITAKGLKSKFSLNIIEGLNDSEITDILKFFTDVEETTEDTLQRRVYLEYWNDETRNYKQSYFYRPDMEFTITEASETDLIYNSLDITFVEY